ncbi:gas vesicle protein GvpJ [Streptomyces avicenniae]|uniref:gas vesicle protein GvpJ n=1 Tax=Streptomyces avicenniae TaxID=500153 RepID=UPI000699488F|nr:gas vesicle protein GvpJ [Streptomyces avicenniae]
MTVATPYPDTLTCAPRSGTLYDVIDIILDRGMVIDVFVRVSLVGIEILRVDVRVVIASVDTYLYFAEVCNRIDLEADDRAQSLPNIRGGAKAPHPPVRHRAAKKVKKTAGSGRKKAKKVKDTLTPGHHRHHHHEHHHDDDGGDE